MTDDAALSALLETEAIRTQMVRYPRYLDERRWDDYVALFDDDGVLAHPGGRTEGAANIRTRVEADLGGYTATHHLTSNYDITVDGDTAVARATFIATHVTAPDGGAYWQGGGVYRIALRRVDGIWRIQALTIEPAWRFAHDTEFPEMSG
jgi:3-phenylpropionate/cinnamic acid dioxygenase small subunit